MDELQRAQDVVSELPLIAEPPIKPAMAGAGALLPHALPALAAADTDAAALLQKVTEQQDTAKMEIMVRRYCTDALILRVPAPSRPCNLSSSAALPPICLPKK